MYRAAGVLPVHQPGHHVGALAIRPECVSDKVWTGRQRLSILSRRLSTSRCGRTWPKSRGCSPRSRAALSSAKTVRLTCLSTTTFARALLSSLHGSWKVCQYSQDQFLVTHSSSQLRMCPTLRPSSTLTSSWTRPSSRDRSGSHPMRSTRCTGFCRSILISW